MRGTQRGFSLFELMVVVILIGVLMAFAIDRFLRLQVDAERISVQHMIGSLNSAIHLQAAELVLNQGIGALKQLENTNPINYLVKPPHNYAGEASDVLADQLSTANWYYDASEKILFYTVNNAEYFVTELSGKPRIRLKLLLVYADNRSSAAQNKIRGVMLKTLDEYHWQPG